MSRQRAMGDSVAVRDGDVQRWRVHGFHRDGGELHRRGCRAEHVPRGNRDRELLHELVGARRDVLPDLQYWKFVDGTARWRLAGSRGSGDRERLSIGQVRCDGGSVPSVRNRMEWGREQRVSDGGAGQARALERRQRAREQLDAAFGRRGGLVRDRVGRGGLEQRGGHRPDGHEHESRVPITLQYVDRPPHGPGKPPHELRELVGGVRVLHLGWWISAQRGECGNTRRRVEASSASYPWGPMALGTNDEYAILRAVTIPAVRMERAAA